MADSEDEPYFRIRANPLIGKFIERGTGWAVRRIAHGGIIGILTDLQIQRCILGLVLFRAAV